MSIGTTCGPRKREGKREEEEREEEERRREKRRREKRREKRRDQYSVARSREKYVLAQSVYFLEESDFLEESVFF